MPNIKSQIARLKTNERDHQSNRARKSQIKTELKKLEEAIASAKAENTAELINKVSSLLDSAARSGAIHRNQASRTKSRLQKKVNKTLAEKK
ncbi:MAG: 30S ribosomal protein S20 [Candidatus Wallbacteria bacterium]